MAATEETSAEVRAVAKYVRTAPRKAQLLTEQIRGLPVAQARSVLAFSTRAAARDVAKVLDSAIANAEANHDLVGDELYVSAAYVGSGPTLKRWRARARGRVGRIRKRTCHITVKVAQVEAAARRAALAPPEPERPTRARRATPPAPVVETPEERPGAEEPAAEAAEPEAAPPAPEKPKRAPRKKAEPPAAAVETEPAADAEALAKPRPARAPRRKAAEGEAESPSEEPAEKPKRAPRTKAPAPESKEGAES